MGQYVVMATTGFTLYIPGSPPIHWDEDLVGNGIGMGGWGNGERHSSHYDM